MRIKIKEAGKLRISLWLPTSLLKSKLIVRSLVKHSHKDEPDEVKDEDDDRHVRLNFSYSQLDDSSVDNTSDRAQLYKMQKQLYKILRDYKRKHGSLTLVEAVSSDGSEVIIKL